MAPPRCVTVVVVTYNSGDTIDGCLQALTASAGDLLDSVILVDNASTDDSVFCANRHSGLRVISNDTNLGFSRACNIGAREAATDYLLFLNPDAQIEPDSLMELVAFMSARPQAACCGPLITDERGVPDPACRRGFPTPVNALGRLFFLEKLFPSSRKFSSYTLPWLGFDTEATVDCVSGACLMIRRAEFEQLGGFDERFFLFGEDIDLCKRVSERGRETWFVPAARIAHIGGHSMRQANDRAQVEFYRAMRLYMAKHWTILPRWLYAMISIGINFRGWLEKYIGH
ncbi:MAG: glycosyltransferase family 2 protein [bacterium]|nr:glycosyltransferase family 2 protein [bacterium]